MQLNTNPGTKEAERSQSKSKIDESVNVGGSVINEVTMTQLSQSIPFDQTPDLTRDEHTVADIY